jgi:hypothetical protein
MPHELKNMKLISQNLLNGYPNIGEGMAIQETADGKRIMWLAHEAVVDYTAVDVTDPQEPVVITQSLLPHPDMRSNSLAVVGDTMYLAHQTANGGLPDGGVIIYDISTPEEPKQIGYFDTSGPNSRGCHVLWCVDAHYAHLATTMPDAKRTSMRDDQFYVIVDVSDPTNPTEVGRWWPPGTMEGDDAPPLDRHQPDMGNSAHNTNVYPERPDRAYCCFKDYGVVILDISDMAHPREISRVDYHPPMPQPAFTHTALPLFDRGLMIVTDESVRQNGEDWPKLVWVMDMSTEENPTILSTLPLPPKEELARRRGRFGAHNIHENQPVPTSFKSDTLIFGTYFNAGLRVHDISNPFQPVEVAYFVPEQEPDAPKTGSDQEASIQGMNINDVYVDENRLVYAVDRLRGGLYILELTI